MMLEVSEISKKIQSSPTRKLFNMAKTLDDVVDFTLGDPDIQTPENIKNAACEAIRTGKTRYSHNAGLIELRETISNYYEKKEGYIYSPKDEIIVTVGAMEGLYLSLLSLINPGDEVIIPAPYYVNYVQMVILCHGIPVIVESSNDDELSFNVCDIEKVVTSKTKAIIINTPSNPSGHIISDDKIKVISDIAKRKDLIVISDEVYKSLIYDKKKFKSIVAIDGMRERTILVNSLSKEFCMTGWRLGYVLGPKKVIETMTKLQENIVACAPLPSQYAAIEALNHGNSCTNDILETFAKRREVLINEFKKVPLVRCNIPEATFYVMVDISATNMTSEEFALTLLREEHVAVVPGIAYGKSCDKYVRIAFTLNEDKIIEGVGRFKRFINKLIK